MFAITFRWPRILALLVSFGCFYIGAPVAMAAPYIITGSGNCYDVGGHGYVAPSFCGITGTTTPTTALTILTPIVTPQNKLRVEVNTETECHGDSSSKSGFAMEQIRSSPWIDDTVCHTRDVAYVLDTNGITRREPGKVKRTCRTTPSGTETCTDYGVLPSEAAMATHDMSTGIGIQQTHIDSDASLLGSAQRMNTVAVALTSTRDFGDWGYTVLVPLRHTKNSDGYGPLDNIQVGLTFAPTYHLLKEQVHGMTVDLGGRFGYNYTSFSDVDAVRDPAGPFNFADFGNLQTAFASLNAQLAKQLTSDARLQLGVEAIGYLNEGADSVMGEDGHMLLATAALIYRFSEKLTAQGSVQAIRFHQNSFDDTARYTNIGLGLGYRLSGFSGFSFDLTRSISGDVFDTTAVNFRFARALQ